MAIAVALRSVYCSAVYITADADSEVVVVKVRGVRKRGAKDCRGSIFPPFPTLLFPSPHHACHPRHATPLG